MADVLHSRNRAHSGECNVLAAEASADGAAERWAALGKRVDTASAANAHITKALRQRVEAERPSADAAGRRVTLAGEILQYPSRTAPAADAGKDAAIGSGQESRDPVVTGQHLVTGAPGVLLPSATLSQYPTFAWGFHKVV